MPPNWYLFSFLSWPFSQHHLSILRTSSLREAVQSYNVKLTSSCLIEDSLSWIRRRSSSVISSSCNWAWGWVWLLKRKDYVKKKKNRYGNKGASFLLQKYLLNRTFLLQSHRIAHLNSKSITEMLTKFYSFSFQWYVSRVIT